MRISPMILGMAMGLVLKDTDIKKRLKLPPLVGNIVTISAGLIAMLIL